MPKASKKIEKINAAYCLAFLFALSVLVSPVVGLADDSAASVAAGGLIPHRETRIVMEKEVLQITVKKVIVDYDFRNNSAEDVTTEVAFPVPPYNFHYEGQEASALSFSDFRLVIGRTPTSFKIETKGTLEGKDITNILIADNIDIPSFGHLKYSNGGGVGSPDLDRLPLAEKKRLASLGLFSCPKTDLS